jgi:hypothetical protein
LNLLKPLVSKGATTESVDLVPTKKFFKPVIVITAPIEADNAELLGVRYLFDEKGNPRPFEGAHHLADELAAASVVFKSKSHGPVTIKTEKVAKLSLSRVEKKGMELKLRIHLPEDKTKLFELLEFLSDLNKEGYTLTVTAAQRSLLEEKPKEEKPEPVQTDLRCSVQHVPKLGHPGAGRCTLAFGHEGAHKFEMAGDSIQ